MKHDVRITVLLVSFFLCAQLIGLLILSNYVDYEKTREKKEFILKPLPFAIERPDVAPEYSFAYILAGVLIATALILVLIKYAFVNLWKFWYLLSVTFCLLIAMGAFFSDEWSLFLAFSFGLWKVFRPNLIIHNFSEMLLYGGLLVVFAPILNLFSVTLLLLLISCYDMYAVWKSKHMIKMAQFLTETKTFAGLFLPYGPGAKISKLKQATGENVIKTKVRHAFLGGGDIAFPLLFNSVVFQELLLSFDLSTAFYWRLLIVPLCATAALMGLFSQSQKDVFYPAMPFLTIGCFVGYGFVWFSLI